MAPVVIAVAVVVKVVNMAAELLINDVRADVVIDFLSGVVVGALTMDIGVGVLAGVNVNVSAAVMTALELPMPVP